MPPEETIEQSSSTSPDQQSSPPEGQLEQKPQDQQIEAQAEETLIPEKFRGKSIQEIVRSYSELEKQFGKISSERSHKDKEAEELKTRLQQLEIERQAILSQAVPAQHVPQEQDPLSDFDQLLAENPQEALKRLKDQVREAPKKVREELNREYMARSAQEFYEKQRKDNPDFAEAEEDMKRLAQTYAPIIRPEFLNSPQVIQALYTMARGNKVDHYAQKAVEKALQSNQQVKEEKRRAYSESSHTAGAEDAKAFKDLSIEEMQKLLGYVPR